ncbi:ankyrin repeat domain-containing protein [Flagellimonas sp.]|uniref:ankyrin repeat domain-containing protein n=1 Tax=Flagellimonas sp. TaxID=2058762 RepID=UPI003AB2AB86
MHLPTIKSLWLGIVMVLAVSTITAQRGDGENPFLDQEFWKSKPTPTEIEAGIAQGHSITEANSGGFDAVTYAIFSNNPVTTISYLVEKGNDVNKRTHDSRTYIFWAASRGHLDIMEYLVGKGARMDLKDSHGYSVAQFTAASGQENTKVYDFLIGNGTDLKNEKDHDGRNILLVAAPRVQNLDLVDYFIGKGLSLDATDDHGNGIFHMAAQGGNLTVLKALVARGVPTRKNPVTGENAILFASRGGRGTSNGLEIYTYLEGLGLNANITSKTGVTPVHQLARATKDLKIFDYFMGKGVDPNAIDAEGNTPLLNAVSRNTMEVVKYFVGKTDAIDHSNQKGHTALALAVQNNGVDIVSYLLEQGARIDVVDPNGNTLVHYLLDTRGRPRDFEDKVKVLKEKGLDFTKPQGDKRNIWHMAVQKNDLGLLAVLGDLGADINARDEQGNTPLHYAAMETDTADILKFLLDHGANATLTTEFGETAFDLASENELLAKNKVDLAFLN